MTVRVKFLNDNNETSYGAACVFFIASIKTNNYKFDGFLQTNLSRDKVEIFICFTIPDESVESSVGAECDWHQPTSITRISQSNCHINSYSGICTLINKHCLYR